MSTLRHLISKRRHSFMLLAVAALTLRLLVPAGFMPTVMMDGGVALLPCPGTTARPVMSGGHGSSQHQNHRAPDRPDRSDMPCAFAALAAPMLDGTDIPAVQLLPPIANTPSPTVDTIGTAARPVRLRPPLRGPPIAS